MKHFKLILNCQILRNNWHEYDFFTNKQTNKIEQKKNSRQKNIKSSRRILQIPQLGYFLQIIVSS